MRKIAIGLAVALIAVLFASCSANMQETGVIPSLTIRAVDGTSKALIGYDGTGAVDSETGITHYTIGVTASDGSVLLSPSSYLPSSSPTYMLTNVISGTYTFTVAGYIEMTDGSYTNIAESSETLAVSPSKPEVEVVLDDFVSGVSKALTIDVVLPQDFTGDGTYSGTLSWEIREGVGLTGAVAGSGTETLSWTDADTSKTITLYADEASPLTGGRYTFIGTLTDSGTESVGTEKKAIEGVRILPGLPASGSISFQQTGITDSKVTVVDKLGNEIELTGSEGVIDVNEDGSVSVTVTGLPEGAAIHWYLNGEETSATVDEDTYTLTGLPGGDSLVEAIVVDGTTSGIGYIAFQCNKVVIQIDQMFKLATPVLSDFWVNAPEVPGPQYLIALELAPYAGLEDIITIHAEFYENNNGERGNFIEDVEEAMSKAIQITVQSPFYVSDNLCGVNWNTPENSIAIVWVSADGFITSDQASIIADKTY